MDSIVLIVVFLDIFTMSVALNPSCKYKLIHFVYLSVGP